MLLQPLIASRAPRMGLVGLSPPENGYGAKESPYLGPLPLNKGGWVPNHGNPQVRVKAHSLSATCWKHRNQKIEKEVEESCDSFGSGD